MADIPSRTRYGIANPERVENPLWRSSFAGNWTGYALRELAPAHYAQPRIILETLFERNEAGNWTCTRPIAIAGENGEVLLVRPRKTFSQTVDFGRDQHPRRIGVSRSALELDHPPRGSGDPLLQALPHDVP